MDGSNRNEARELVARMVAGLNDHVIEGMEEYWHEDMVWYGPAGIGTLHGLHGFQDGQQRPFLHAFSDKQADDEIIVAEGDYVAATGHQHATHTGEWLGIPASGQRVQVRYMDFWRAENGKLTENWVLIDILGFLEQLGYNVGNVLKFIGSKPPEFFDEAASVREDGLTEE